MTREQKPTTRRIRKSHAAHFHARGASKKREWFPDDYEINRDFYLTGAPKKEPRKGRWLSNRTLKQPTTQQVNKFNKMMCEIASEMKDIPVGLTSELRYHRRGHVK